MLGADAVGYFERACCVIRYQSKKPNAAVRFVRAVNCGRANCRLAHLGATGISVEAGSHGCQIVGNIIEDVAGNEIQLGEINFISPKPADLVKDNTIAHNEVSALLYFGITIGWRWNRQPTQAKRNCVEHNHVHYVAQLFANGRGI